MTEKEELQKCPTCGNVDVNSISRPTWRCNPCIELMIDNRFDTDGRPELALPIPYADLGMEEID